MNNEYMDALRVAMAAVVEFRDWYRVQDHMSTTPEEVGTRTEEAARFAMLAGRGVGRVEMINAVEDIPREPHERLSADRSTPFHHYSAGSADGYNRGLQAALDAMSELLGNPLTGTPPRDGRKQRT